MKSKHFDKVKQYYSSGLWTLQQVKNAVVKAWITESEFKEITGQKY